MELLKDAASAWGVSIEQAARALEGKEHDEFWHWVNADMFLCMKLYERTVSTDKQEGGLMAKEQMAMAWEQCAMIVEAYDMSTHPSPLSDVQIDLIYRLCDDMRDQAEELRHGKTLLKV